MKVAVADEVAEGEAVVVALAVAVGVRVRVRNRMGRVTVGKTTVAGGVMSGGDVGTMEVGGGGGGGVLSGGRTEGAANGSAEATSCTSHTLKVININRPNSPVKKAVNFRRIILILSIYSRGGCGAPATRPVRSRLAPFYFQYACRDLTGLTIIV